MNFDKNVEDGEKRGIGMAIRDNKEKILVAGVRRVKDRWCWT